MKTLLLFVTLSVITLSCARERDNQFLDWMETPELLNISGRWDDKPAIQVRELGESKMVQFTAYSRIALQPDIPGLDAAIDWANAKAMHWVEPATGACELSQLQLVPDPDDNRLLGVIAWGWDKPDQPHCENLFQLAEKKGVQLSLERLRVRRMFPIERVAISLTP